MLSFQARIEVQCRAHGGARDRECEPCRVLQSLEVEYTGLCDQRRRYLERVAAVLTKFRETVYLTNLK